MKNLIQLLLLCATLNAGAATYSSYVMTFTNTTVSGNSVTVNGSTARFTNAPLNSVNWITTGSSNTSATNFFLYLGGNFPSLIIGWGSSNVVNLGGVGLTFTISGGFGFVTTNSSTVTNGQAVMWPEAGLYDSNRIGQASSIARGMVKATNVIDVDSVALSKFTSITGAQTLTRKILTNAVTLGGTNVDVTITNAIRINATNASFDTVDIRAGTITNTAVQKATSISGTVDAFTGGSATNLFVTNSPSILVSNLVVTKRFEGTNGIFDRLTATNFSAPGSGANSTSIGGAATNTASVQIGKDGLAGGQGDVSLGQNALVFSTDDLTVSGNVGIGNNLLGVGVGVVVLGVSADAEGTNVTAVGALSAVTGAGDTSYGASAFGAKSLTAYDFAASLGYGSQATKTNQVRLGTETNTVSVPGSLESVAGTFGKASFTNIVGSNYLSGRFASLAGAYSGLVDGNNANIPTGTNAVIEMSGGTTIAQIAGFVATGDGDEFEARFTGAVTNWIVNELNSSFSTSGTAANRIKTGTGGDITLTNQPAWARFRYRGASSRWELKSWSR